jgi:lysophospholipase L1-like esterase
MNPNITMGYNWHSPCYIHSMSKLYYVILALLISACGKGLPIQPYCPGPANDTAQIHFFGDSITYGSASASDGSAAFGYAQITAQTLGLTVNDVAVPGSVIASCGELPSILDSNIQAGQTYVFFTGTNDAHTNQGSDLPQFTADFQVAYNHLTATAGAKVLFIGPYYLQRDTTDVEKSVIDSYNNAIQSIAGNRYLDLRSVVNPNTMLVDGTHPNSLGQEAIATVVEAALVD